MEKSHESFMLHLMRVISLWRLMNLFIMQIFQALIRLMLDHLLNYFAALQSI